MINDDDTPRLESSTEPDQAPPRRRPRRRLTQTRTYDTTVPSPCVQVCWFSEGSNYCDGCYRTADEIRDWFTMNREQKLYLLEQLQIRRIEPQK